MLTFLLGILITLIVSIAAAAIFPEVPVLAWLYDQLSVIQAIGSLAIASSAIVAFFLYKRTSERHSEEDAFKASEVFLNEAIRLLERTYEVFTDNGENLEPPRNSRLLWLTVARMIVRFDNIKLKITVPAHMEIAEEHHEYWRYQFYKILDANSANFNMVYLQPSGIKYGGDNVPRKSIAIVFNFARWNGPDVLDGIDDKQLFASRIVQIDQFRVIEYLEQYDDYWQEVMEIRERDYPDP